ncbi:vascular endothelial growth factor A-like [Brevipalpus obovatus]|uniref:vascular endothelial growth factor A-like n=1 Tax=Brevipalpus obovatus TaxID=246614 RepID=UPI003D9EFF78
MGFKIFAHLDNCVNFFIGFVTIFVIIGPSLVSSVIVFPQNQSFKNQSRLKPSLDEALVRAGGIQNASQLFELLGIDNGISGKSGPANFATQTVCEPEMTTVSVGEKSVDGNEYYFPDCVRVARCGGCCDIKGLMACTPTKVTQKSIKRAKIRIRRDVPPNQSVQTVQVDVHEECKCLCKVTEKHCDSSIHDYRPNECRCACKNSDNEIECYRMPNKMWDNSKCTCKCRNESHCPSGTVFSHSSCSCAAV